MLRTYSTRLQGMASGCQGTKVRAMGREEERVGERGPPGSKGVGIGRSVGWVVCGRETWGEAVGQRGVGVKV